jgi:hypothetical protein
MIFVLNDGGVVSPKAKLVVDLFREGGDEVFYIFRKNKLTETWGSHFVELSDSTVSAFGSFALMPIKSPGALRDGVLRRFFGKKGSRKLLAEGFLSNLGIALSYCLTYSTKTDRLVEFLRASSSPKIFLIDEFSGSSIVDLKVLKEMGKIVYISQDFASDRFGFSDNRISKALVRKLEDNVIAQADLIIACSERDQLKYTEKNAKKVVFYPNIYPLQGVKPVEKAQSPTICVVLKDYWGSQADSALEEILRAMALLTVKVTVVVIGKKPQKMPKNASLQYYKSIPDKAEFLRIMGKAWVCINVGFHLGGSNERKNDYSMAGCVVLSDRLGARGDFLPFEYTYVDCHDLTAKLKQLFRLGRNRLQEMGAENHEYILRFAEGQKEKLRDSIYSLLPGATDP